MNCSSMFTVYARLLRADTILLAAAALQVGSSLVDPFSVMAAANSALYGPLHVS